MQAYIAFYGRPADQAGLPIGPIDWRPREEILAQSFRPLVFLMNTTSDSEAWIAAPW